MTGSQRSSFNLHKAVMSRVVALTLMVVVTKTVVITPMEAVLILKEVILILTEAAVLSQKEIVLIARQDVHLVGTMMEIVLVLEDEEVALQVETMIVSALLIVFVVAVVGQVNAIQNMIVGLVEEAIHRNANMVE